MTRKKVAYIKSEWPWVNRQNIQWHEASRGLCATAELVIVLGRVDRGISQRRRCCPWKRGRYCTSFPLHPAFVDMRLADAVVFFPSWFIQVALLSQRGRAMLCVCQSLASTVHRAQSYIISWIWYRFCLDYSAINGLVRDFAPPVILVRHFPVLHFSVPLPKIHQAVGKWNDQKCKKKNNFATMLRPTEPTTGELIHRSPNSRLGFRGWGAAGIIGDERKWRKTAWTFGCVMMTYDKFWTTVWRMWWRQKVYIKWAARARTKK